MFPKFIPVVRRHDDHRVIIDTGGLQVCDQLAKMDIVKFDFIFIQSLDPCLIPLGWWCLAALDFT